MHQGFWKNIWAQDHVKQGSSKLLKLSVLYPWITSSVPKKSPIERKTICQLIKHFYGKLNRNWIVHWSIFYSLLFLVMLSKMPWFWVFWSFIKTVKKKVSRKLAKSGHITQLMSNQNVMVGFLGKLSKPKEPRNCIFFVVMPFPRKWFELK